MRGYMQVNLYKVFMNNYNSLNLVRLMKLEIRNLWIAIQTHRQLVNIPL